MNKIKNWSMGLVIIGVLFMSGCVTVEGPATKLQAAPGFAPKKIYNVSCDQMWDKVKSVLVNKEGFILNQVSKENNLIQTDYIYGWTVDVAAISTTRYRYKYQLAFEKISPSQTRLEIKCKVEGKEFLKGGNAAEEMEKLRQYEDATSPQEQKAAVDLENWLYEQIENSL